VGEKDKRIYELKKKNTELEKFKFVLDYKIKELKRQIEPRENEIADMRTQVCAARHHVFLLFFCGEGRRRRDWTCRKYKHLSHVPCL